MLKSVPFLRIAVRLVLAVCVGGILPPSLAPAPAAMVSAVHAGIAASGQFDVADAAAVPPRVVARTAGRSSVTRRPAIGTAIVATLAAATALDSASARPPVSTGPVRSALRLPNPLRGPPSLI